MIHQTPNTDLGDMSPPAAEVPPTALDEADADRHDARLRRVHEYLASSLAKEDALEANLGSINSGLMRMALGLDEAIEAFMESGPRTVDRLQRMLPALETHLRVTRQVDRFAQLEVRSHQARQPKGAADVRAAIPSEGPAAVPIGQSEESQI